MMLKQYYGDFHIHIGRDQFNRPVKITGAKSLTLTNILQEVSRRKGIQMIGVIDCHAPGVIAELETLLEQELAYELEEGGIQFESVTLILGTELEIYDEHCQGPIHVLCYLPYFEKMKQFSQWLASYMTNINLSSQRVYLSSHALQKKVKELDGLFIPAHVFTPFKSLYGRGVHRSLTEVFDPEMIDAIELGLSADSTMADHLQELHRFPYLSNSDAHSLAKLGREYQLLALARPNFTEFKLALLNQSNRTIVANYGLNPKLGKYHQTVCKHCLTPNPTQQMCQQCQRTGVIKGVSERIAELSDCPAKDRPNRPPYYYHIPLEYVNGLGKKTYERLLEAFGTEMAIIHQVNEQDLSAVAGTKIAKQIIAIRKGEVVITPGGGGKYGRIKRQ